MYRHLVGGSWAREERDRRIIVLRQNVGSSAREGATSTPSLSSLLKVDFACNPSPNLLATKMCAILSSRVQIPRSPSVQGRHQAFVTLPCSPSTDTYIHLSLSLSRARFFPYSTETFLVFLSLDLYAYTSSSS